MSIVDKLLNLVAPYECLGCGTEGTLLCRGCADKCVTVPERCYRCRKRSPAGLTCVACRRTSKLHSVRPAVVYEGAAKDLVWKLKFAGAQTAAKVMAARMSSAREPHERVVIVAVPTATSRVRQRGYDQAQLLARELAQRMRRPYVSYLARSGQQHQVGASRAQRLRQLTDAFYVPRPALVRGAYVILVDDVVTTGATLEAAAAVLRAAGAKHVEALVFAQP